PDRVLALGADFARLPYVPGDGVRVHANGPVADDLRGAVMSQVTGQRPAEPDARRIVAFDGNRAAVDHVAGVRAAGADAEPVGALGERTVEVAIVVRVGRRVALVHRDRPGIDDVTARARGRENADRSAGVRDADGALVGHGVIAVHRHRRPAGRLHRTRRGDRDRIRGAVLDGRGLHRLGDRGRDVLGRRRG